MALLRHTDKKKGHGKGKPKEMRASRSLGENKKGRHPFI